ncbi:ATP-grasp domain-containing protein [Dyella choica]|uniref:Prokaryotic glutathione synthetase ATP-binding domain-containing protein n=1 Tax=Dyella choica TaxID=1927959 RepID=A0A3S0RL35_9GAMM|nr:hypothetical protein [Dyella choica]RUL76636.1 hypothetical protein EKH80_07865 [Dyella choica]
MPTQPFRLAIASSRQYSSLHEDDLHLATMLERVGMKSTVCVWNDPELDWTAYDAVLVRTIWDYYEHYPAFLAWTHTLDRLGITVINDTGMLRWNSDKHYLLDLQRQGVPIIPTRAASGVALHEMLSAMDAREIVIKPTVSGGAWHTVRGRIGSADFEQALAQLPQRLDYLVQPFVPEIASNGEWSLLYFGGEFSHAVLKRPMSGDYRVQVEHGGSITPAMPDQAMLNAGGKILAAVGALGHQQPLYARVDGVVANGQFLTMELELIEPSLFLADRPDATERFAHLLLEQLRQLGHEARRLG